MLECWISVGSNVEREHSIRHGIADLKTCFGSLLLSPVYESAAVGFVGAPFYNLVVGINTTASVGEINRQLRQIEDRHGRQRGIEKFSARTLDLDLLTYGDAVGCFDGYMLPRPDIECPFVLAPLAAIAAAERHPLSGQTYGALWSACPPPAHASVRQIQFEF